MRATESYYKPSAEDLLQEELDRQVRKLKDEMESLDYVKSHIRQEIIKGMINYLVEQL